MGVGRRRGLHRAHTRVTGPSSETERTDRENGTVLPCFRRVLELPGPEPSGRRISDRRATFSQVSPGCVLPRPPTSPLYTEDPQRPGKSLTPSWMKSRRELPPGPTSVPDPRGGTVIGAVRLEYGGRQRDGLCPYDTRELDRPFVPSHTRPVLSDGVPRWRRGGCRTVPVGDPRHTTP